MNARIEAEIVALHQFFEDWFNARLPNTDDAFSRFTDALALDFEMVTPAGNIAERDSLLKSLRSAFGQRMGVRIWIENVRIRIGHNGFWLATYEEWQEVDGASQGRVSTVLFVVDAAAPGGFMWRHVHETFLPQE